ncbi:MAG: beta-lactamase family protein [Desulfarculaceae bacterium]|nr:beta-lactamase family protein [Desulfarculaceae bacterium]MCF8070982.1 beta-lactamase family protein [Desulfarculaceae bacterium]MCF8116596.1 beta-lactamase family protein [Desulfarculaceae bacterium]
MSEAALRQALEQGVASGAAPAAVLLLWAKGKPLSILAAGQADEDTVFDLASLTKPLAAAPLSLELDREGVVPWDATLYDLWGQAVPEDKEEITPGQLLAHAAGYPAYQPYFQAMDQQPPAQRRALLRSMLMNEPLAHAPGSRALYSDLGYMALGLLLEHGFATGLDEAFTAMQERLGVTGPRYLPVGQPLPWPKERIAPCGSLPGRPRIHGQAEDENCFSLGGVAGHAGLFGTAVQVAAHMEALAGDMPELFAKDRATPDTGRTFGFDTPSGPDSLAGPNPPLGTVGHLGFTGCSLWWHPASGRGVVLLTNRVALGRDNDRLNPLRRSLHQIAWQVLGEAA